VVRKNFDPRKFSVDVGESAETIAAETTVAAVIAYLLAA
jgi:hypothetical protein